MRTHLRNLLLLAALCWVAPASAGQQAADETCPNAGSPVAMTAEGGAGAVRVSDSGRAFLP
jgi:hypothetical protein